MKCRSQNRIFCIHIINHIFPEKTYNIVYGRRMTWMWDYVDSFVVFLDDLFRNYLYSFLLHLLNEFRFYILNQKKTNDDREVYCLDSEHVDSSHENVLQVTEQILQNVSI